MKRTWLIQSLLSAAVFLHANDLTSTAEPAYDADLFKRDTPAFSFHGSFLFWRVQESALDYALKMQHASPSSTVYAQGKYHTATFDGEPGFRVAASYFRAPKYWEMWLQYTRLTARGKNSVERPDQSDRFLTGTWPEIIDTPLSKANSYIHLNYNVTDFFVDRFFNPNPHLRIRLLGGGTVAWMNQNWVVRYFNESEAITQIRNRWKFIGGGFRIGTMVDWYCGYDLYLTSSTTLATVLGSYHNQSMQTASTETLPVRDAHYSDIRPAVSIQALLGLSWQKNFCSTRMEIFGGYELNSWFNLNEVYRSTSSSSAGAKETWINTGMIALQGLTTRATLDF
jgi:hypothetical protein